jgi:hypothetical protein
VVFEQRYAWGRAYRDGTLVCGRVNVIVDHDVRVGLAPRERRRRFIRALSQSASTRPCAPSWSL